MPMMTSWHRNCVRITGPMVLWYMMTSSNGNIFRVTRPLCGEFTGSRLISPHKGQRRGTLMFCLICSWKNGWLNNRDVGDLRRHRVHYYIIVIKNLAFDLQWRERIQLRMKRELNNRALRKGTHVWRITVKSTNVTKMIPYVSRGAVIS